MHVAQIATKNFRNLGSVTVPLHPGTVIVGENRAGKSNLIHALRLVLDPTLPNSERQLRREDFWDGLSDGSSDWDPMVQRAEVEISLEFADIGDDPEILTALGQALIEGDPMRAQITYRFAPRDSESQANGPPPYEWRITGGISQEDIRRDVRTRLRVQYLSALRNVENDITYWGRSPLRPLLEAATQELDDKALRDVAAAVYEANTLVLELKPFADLSEKIATRTTTLVGPESADPSTLGVTSSDAQRILRGLRLFIDDGKRPLAAASLGSLNVLYFALLQLGLEHELRTNEIAHAVLAIEEPEAHLHPHLQRLIFSDALRSPTAHERTVIVTTHSPHIVSVTPPQALVILRANDRTTTVGVASDADLTAAEWDDIERYLDATRGEMVFARRVLLVEGFSEAVLLPKLAHDQDLDLDKYGISVCAIHGTHFASYAKYLTALGTPWAVITDGDPYNEVTGAARVDKLLRDLGLPGPASDHGIFLGDMTIEPDLVAASSSNLQTVLRVLSENEWAAPTATAIEKWRESQDYDLDALLRVVNRYGKGRFAQRLAAQTDAIDAPQYVADAFAYLTP